MEYVHMKRPDKTRQKPCVRQCRLNHDCLVLCTGLSRTPFTAHSCSLSAQILCMTTVTVAFWASSSASLLLLLRSLFAFLFPPYTCPSFNSLLRVCQLKVFFNRSLPINVLSLEVPATFLHICSFLHFFYILINLFKFKMVIIITEESGCRLIPVLNFISVVSSFFQGFKKKDSCPLEILY